MNAMNSIHIYLLLLTLRFSSSIFLKPEAKKIYIYINGNGKLTNYIKACLGLVQGWQACGERMIKFEASL
jgi:hypothetical protein